MKKDKNENGTIGKDSPKIALFARIVAYIKSRGYDPATYLHLLPASLKRILEGRQFLSFYAVHRL